MKAQSVEAIYSSGQEGGGLERSPVEGGGSECRVGFAGGGPNVHGFVGSPLSSGSGRNRGYGGIVASLTVP